MNDPVIKAGFRIDYRYCFREGIKDVPAGLDDMVSKENGRYETGGFRKEKAE